MTKLLSGRADVERFRALILHKLGLRFDDDKLEYLGEILRERLAAWREKSADFYLRDLAQAGATDAELRVLAQRLTVNETYFFRNLEQFNAVGDIALPHAIRAREKQRVLRILSAGCASGEEAYTLAILLREKLPDLGTWAVRICGIDISPAMIEKAQAGRYSDWSLRGTPDAMRDRYFRREGKEFILDENVRKMADFEERNLIADDAGFWQPDTFDIVFCRNVSMYFPADVTQGLMMRIARSLTDGGFLFLGHAETLRGLSNAFHLRHTHDTFYYQRRDASEHYEELLPPLDRTGFIAPVPAAPLEASTSWIDAIQKASERIAILARNPGDRSASIEAGNGTLRPKPPSVAIDIGMALELLRQERFADAMEILGKMPAEAQRNGDVQLLRAVLLTHAGKLADAEKVCTALLATDELNAGAHYVAALCAEHSGDLRGAEEHDQTAAYLDNGFAMPHLHLGLLAKRGGDRESARRELGQARDLLRCEDPSRILFFGGGFSRESLIELCTAELRMLGGPA